MTIRKCPILREIEAIASEWVNYFSDLGFIMTQNTIRFHEICTNLSIAGAGLIIPDKDWVSSDSGYK